MKMNSISPNFKGISNVLSNTVRTNNATIQILSMKLDNIDSEDLNIYRDLKQKLNFNQDMINSDVLTISHALLDDNNECFFINGRPILNGEDMRELTNSQFKTNAEMQAYKLEETAHIKLYTFIAKLTQKLMNLESVNINNDMIHVVKETFDNLSDLFHNEQIAYHVTQDSISNLKPFQERAQKLNQYILKTMKIFFA